MKRIEWFQFPSNGESVIKAVHYAVIVHTGYESFNSLQTGKRNQRKYGRSKYDDWRFQFPSNGKA